MMTSFFFFFLSPVCTGKVNKCNTVSSLCNCGLVALEGGGKKTLHMPPWPTEGSRLGPSCSAVELRDRMRARPTLAG